jgi:multidrug resistance efflux pump
MKKKTFLSLSILLAFTLILTACSSNGNTTITASGTLSAVEVSVAPQVGGQVVSVNVNEGDTVTADEVLFNVDSAVAQAQYNQAKAGADAAAATLTAAQAQLTYAQTQLDLARQGARAQDMQARLSVWSSSVPDNFKPSWYFQKSEQITAAQADVDAAQKALTDEQENLQQVLKDASNQDFIDAEKRLAQAQVAYTNAQTTLDQAKTANDQKITDAAQTDFDSAQSELTAAQTAYDKMLKSDSADAVLKARARVAVAQARYATAQDSLSALQTGEDSLQVSVAAAGANQAQAAVAQAKANVDQVNAALALSQLQLEKTTVKTPIAGTVLARNVEVGDLVAAGGVVMTVAKLDSLNLTVYIPENQYGQITIGQKVEIQVDSFPGKTFIGNVTSVADEAEYTPRNVQTTDGRTSTVYAVKIAVPNADTTLKPGMPADVTFLQSDN